MVISCAAVNCTNRQGKVDKTEISFHRFPINNARRLAKWERAVRRENWMPNKYSFLCSKHFTPDCFLLRYEDQHRQLKASAVPSIFDFTVKDRSSGGHIRKKVLSLQAAEDKEREDKERCKIINREAVSCKRPAPTSVVVPKEINIISLLVREDSGAVSSDTYPEGVLPAQAAPQLAVGEWSLDGGEEVFTPSSCNLIDALHSYSSTSRQERGIHRQRRGLPGRESAGEMSVSHLRSSPWRGFLLKTRLKHACYRRDKSLVWQQQLQRRAKYLHTSLYMRKLRRDLEITAEAPLNPAVLALDWLLGSWESDEPGEGSFPTIPPFRYTETLLFSHVGQPVINFMFNAFNAESKKPLHRECGFIRVQPGTNRVAFIIAQNSGLVEIEEGELTGQQLSLHTHALARTSFAREPHVQQISRLFKLRSDGKLEQTICMATVDQPLTQHLHITYRRSS